MQRLHRRTIPRAPIDAYIQRIALKTRRSSRPRACWARATSGSASSGSRSGSRSRSRTTSSTASATRRDRKIPGADLREGVPTLPLLLAAREDEVVRRALAGGRSRARSSASPRPSALDGPGPLALDYARKARELPAGRARTGGTHAHRHRPGAAERMAVAELSTLEPIREKIEAGERLGFEDGLALLESDDLLALGELADLARRRRGGTDEVFFVQNLYVNQTNVCRVKCKFCAFAATQKQEHAYTFTVRGARRGRAPPARGRPGSRRSTWSTARTRTSTSSSTATRSRRCTRRFPDVHLKCYTASEIHHMTTLSGMTHEDVLRELKDGGPRVAARRRRRGLRRPRAAPRRARQGEPGHLVPRPRHRARARDPHALHAAVRARRDIRGAGRPHPSPARAAGPTGGFRAFIPLAFHPENTVFERRAGGTRRARTT